MEKYAKKIDTHRYGDYTNNDHDFFQKNPFKIASDMILICASLFQIEHKNMIKLLITLCKHSNDRYHLNILKTIAVIYHQYIACESYNLAYITKTGWFYEQ